MWPLWNRTGKKKPVSFQIKRQRTLPEVPMYRRKAGSGVRAPRTTCKNHATLQPLGFKYILVVVVERLNVQSLQLDNSFFPEWLFKSRKDWKLKINQQKRLLILTRHTLPSWLQTRLSPAGAPARGSPTEKYWGRSGKTSVWPQVAPGSKHQTVLRRGSRTLIFQVAIRGYSTLGSGVGNTDRALGRAKCESSDAGPHGGRGGAPPAVPGNPRATVSPWGGERRQTTLQRKQEQQHHFPPKGASDPAQHKGGVRTRRPAPCKTYSIRRSNDYTHTQKENSISALRGDVMKASKMPQ